MSLFTRNYTYLSFSRKRGCFHCWALNLRFELFQAGERAKSRCIKSASPQQQDKTTPCQMQMHQSPRAHQFCVHSPNPCNKMDDAREGEQASRIWLCRIRSTTTGATWLFHNCFCFAPSLFPQFGYPPHFLPHVGCQVTLGAFLAEVRIDWTIPDFPLIPCQTLDRDGVGTAARFWDRAT